jgi:hypothetical protein
MLVPALMLLPCRLREALYNHAAGKFKNKDFQGSVKFFAATLEVCGVSSSCNYACKVCRQLLTLLCLCPQPSLCFL